MTADIRSALEKCAAALLRLPSSEKDVIKFTGDWSHYGSMTVAEIIDYANDALCNSSLQPARPSHE